MSRRFIGVIVVGVLAASLSASAKELADVTMPDTLSAGGKTLQLNGLGLRNKAMFKVYVGALYLETPSKDPAAILGSNQAKVVRMHFVRDLSKDQLADAFKEGFEAKAKEKLATQKTNIEKFLVMLAAVKEGEELTFSYVPGSGTTVLKGTRLSA